MRFKPPWRRVTAKLRSDRSSATGPNQLWAMDWMHDELFDGRRLWVLTVVDTFMRVCPVMRVCRSATAEVMINALEEAGRRIGLPTSILFYKLERMRIVSNRRMPPEVVGMGSSIAYRSGNSDDRQITLVYPAHADISASQISVLTPIGTALLGLRTGHSTTWTARDGRSHLLRVLSVRQPELVD